MLSSKWKAAIAAAVLAIPLFASGIATNFFTLKSAGTIQTVDNVLIENTNPGFGVSQGGLTRGTWFANAAGTLFEVGRYDNAGAYLDDYMTFTRSNGNVEFPHNVTIDGTCTGCSGGGGSVTNIATTSPLGGGPITTTGTLTCSTCTITIGSGTIALSTSAISSAACTSAQTVAISGTAATDTVLVSFNADPTAVTGYVPLTTGMLTIIPYPTTNTVNVKVCNNTSSSITPGAITLNARVVR